MAADSVAGCEGASPLYGVWVWSAAVCTPWWRSQTHPARFTKSSYDAEIGEVGRFTAERHLNYTFLGSKQPAFPGGFPSNHALNGMPQFAYGITEWFERGLYIPWAGGRGEDARKYASHSLRSVLDFPRPGASVFKMRDVSRHKSIDVLQAYVRDPETFVNHTGAGLY